MIHSDSSRLASNRLLSRTIETCARRPWLTLCVIFALSAWGYVSLKHSPLDALPDLSDTQVIIFTEWEGRSPDLVEDQITYPVSSAFLSAPQVKFVRGQSFFGLSFVYVIFEEGTDLYWARSRVLEYLSQLQGSLPKDAEPSLGPDATGAGWVFQYALVDRTGEHDLSELRSLQDWVIRYALQSVPGVAEVASIGGHVKEYQVQIDPLKLRALNVSLSEVIEAVRKSNQAVGGRTIEIAGHEHMIRGRGYIDDLQELRKIPIRVNDRGVPILVEHVAEVHLVPSLRRGIVELNGEGEVAGGIVIMRPGQRALDVIDSVKERMTQLEESFPEGVEVVVTYDRSELIHRSIQTLRTTLLEEMLVVSFVIFFFLLHVRSALVAVMTLPVAVLLSFIPMFFQGFTINLMSLGGIAIAIGALVDASIVLIENIHKKIAESEDGDDLQARIQGMISAMQEVGPSIFFSLLVITVSFLPVFTLEGAEGKLFRPLAFTKTYAMGWGAVLSVTLAPALAALLIRGKIQSENKNPVHRLLVATYEPVVRFVVEHRKMVLALAALAMVFTVPAFFRLESEFMPPLNEGVILYMPSAPPGMSVTESARMLRVMDQKIKEIPEVKSVFGKMGRAETATDPAPLGMAETTIVLKPRSEWRAGMTWEKIVEELDARVSVPGMPNLWWMPIQTRTEMLSTGVRSPIGIQVFGDDLKSIERASQKIEQAMMKVPGTRSAFAERSTGGFYIDMDIKKNQAMRYGLTVQEIHGVIATALGGMEVSQTIEGRERYPIRVRYAREYRDRPDLLDEILVTTSSGAQIPLKNMADVSFSMGPPMIRSEDGKLVGFVFVDTARPIEDYVHDAKRVVHEQVHLDPGMRVEWVGQFKYAQRAKEKLMWVVPLTLLVIVCLLYLNTKSWVETMIVLLAVPFSLIGAVWMLYLLDYHMSVAVWVGLIALAGLDAETGIVMLLYLTLSYRSYQSKGHMRNKDDLRQAIVDGAAKRIRPKLMTVMTSMLGLLPILWSTSAGADVMKRMAAPMIGGLVSSFLLELTVYPAVFAIWKNHTLKRRSLGSASESLDNSQPGGLLEKGL